MICCIRCPDTCGMCPTNQLFISDYVPPSTFLIPHSLAELLSLDKKRSTIVSSIVLMSALYNIIKYVIFQVMNKFEFVEIAIMKLCNNMVGLY